MRILSYNIHKGFSASRTRFVLEHMRDALRAVGPDLVLLQEAVGEHRLYERHLGGWPEASQFEFLADEVWPHYAYGRNAVHQRGHHGNAILSKYPILSWENIDMTLNRFEQRGLLHAVVQRPGAGELHVCSLHMNLLENARRRQLETLCQRVRRAIPDGRPLVIGGDFNDWRGAATPYLRECIGAREAFEVVRGSHARTFPSWHPVLSLDRVYVRNLEVTGASVLRRPPWTRLSDHLAVLVEVAEAQPGSAGEDAARRTG